MEILAGEAAKLSASFSTESADWRSLPMISHRRKAAIQQ